MNINTEYIKASATEDIANQYIGNPDGYKSVTGRCPVKEISIQANLIRCLLEKIESLQAA